LIAGVTGTRNGATNYQLASAATLFVACAVTVLHSGDCIGADEQMYHMGRAFHAKCIIHPPKIDKYRAFCGDCRDEWWPEKSYWERDQDTVNESEVLFGFPKGVTEELEHSGTWATIRYARTLARPIAVVWPNGHIGYENWGG
jgi:hypothetical protein